MNIQNVEQLRQFIVQREIEAIDLKFADLTGRWRHITVPARSAKSDKLFTQGVGFDGSSVSGFTRLESGDLVAIPDPTTAFVDPFWEAPTLSLICSIHEADTREQFGRDPRSIAIKAEVYLNETGIGTHSVWGPEHEFHVFDHVAVENDPETFGCEITLLSPDNKEIPYHGNGYHGQPPNDREYLLRAYIVHELERVGIPIKYHHHEVGASGQNEIEMDRQPMVKAGDFTMIIKYMVRMAAERFDRVATFMPKPLYAQPGNGMHFHQQIMKGGDAPFAGDTYAGLSPLALHYVAGVLHHAPALTAICNPSTNSFKRLTPGFEAPVNLFFGMANRSACIRVPKYATDPVDKRVEFRSPDATANPYLAMAAQLLAGIDGIQKQMDPTAMGFGPFDDNVLAWPEEKRKGIAPLPSSFPEAIAALEADHDFLLQGGVFSEDMLEAFVDYKRRVEVEEMARRPHPYEMQLYFDL